MILYGASGHAKVIADILSLNNINIEKVIDDNRKIHSLLNYSVELPHESDFDQNNQFIISIGNNNIRKKIFDKYSMKLGKAIHPSAKIDKSVDIDSGTVIMANTVINSSTIIGKNVIVNTSASIDHDCIIGDFVHVSPNSCLCGCVKIGEGTHLGAGSVVIPGVKIGKWSIIGAGSVIINDIPDNVTVVGNPGRIIKHNNKKK